MICMKCKRNYQVLKFKLHLSNRYQKGKNESTFIELEKTPMKRAFLYLDIISWLKQNRKQKN
jgi:hypothetical protein